jgi:hypothetical protein
MKCVGLMTVLAETRAPVTTRRVLHSFTIFGGEVGFSVLSMSASGLCMHAGVGYVDSATVQVAGTWLQ